MVSQGTKVALIAAGALVVILLVVSVGRFIKVDSRNESLFLSSVKGDYKAAESLVEAEADPNYRSDSEETPPYQAIKNDSLPMARLLLEHGGDQEMIVYGKPIRRYATSRKMRDLLGRWSNLDRD